MFLVLTEHARSIFFAISLPLVIMQLLKQRGLLPELGLQIETLSAHWIGISRAKLLQLLLISGKKVKVLTWFWKINPLNGMPDFIKNLSKSYPFQVHYLVFHILCFLYRPIINITSVIC